MSISCDVSVVEGGPGGTPAQVEQAASLEPWRQAAADSWNTEHEALLDSSAAPVVRRELGLGRSERTSAGSYEYDFGASRRRPDSG